MLPFADSEFRFRINMKNRIRTRIKKKNRIRTRIKMRSRIRTGIRSEKSNPDPHRSKKTDTDRRIRIRIKLKRRVRFRIRIEVTSRIRIRTRNTVRFKWMVFLPVLLATGTYIACVTSYKGRYRSCTENSDKSRESFLRGQKLTDVGKKQLDKWSKCEAVPYWSLVASLLQF
jgi:hypothetical protein